MNIGKILEAKGSTVFVVRPSDSIASLSKLLRTHRIGAAVVSRDGRTIEGVISERDIAYALSIHEAGLHGLSVSQLMTETVITCSPHDPVARVASTMLSTNTSHLPVEEHGRLIGVVSLRDILEGEVDDRKRKAALLQRFVREAKSELRDSE